MGCFSWKYCDAPKGSRGKDRKMAIGRVRDSFLLVPKEFGGGSIKETCYDGYGHIGSVDVYDMVAEWNKNSINAEFIGKGLHPPKLESYGGLYEFQKEELRNNGSSEEEIQAKDYEKKNEYFLRACKRYEFARKRLVDYCSGLSDEEMIEKYGRDFKREIGIDIACYDEDNEKLPYPIKIACNSSSIYENCKSSKNDPHQGF